MNPAVLVPDGCVEFDGQIESALPRAQSGCRFHGKVDLDFDHSAHSF